VTAIARVTVTATGTLAIVTATAGPAVASLTGDYFSLPERGRVWGLAILPALRIYPRDVATADASIHAITAAGGSTAPQSPG
jgi:hypothetical protein